ncbi:MAG: DUF952 domain-containing protein [Ilumatobacteraceae bacterium]
MLFHIALPEDWSAAQDTGRYTTSSRGVSLAQEGYIHCSFGDQVAATAQRYYADVGEVVLLQIDPDLLTSPVVVEDLAGSGQPFPHVYGPIDLAAVVSATPADPATIRF